MLITGVKSRPLYQPLRFDAAGRFHLVVGQGDGGRALLRLLGEMPVSVMRRVIYTGESLTKCDVSDELRTQSPEHLTLLPTQAAALRELDAAVAAGRMGTRLYVAGSESFIGAVEQIAARYNLQPDELQREHLGSQARRVYCIHCQASLEDVTTNVVRCTGCGRQLIVRDHYSRRLAAFMGVMADAEAPGILPAVREAFA